MNLKLFNNSSPKNMVVKTPKELMSLTGTLRDATSITNPTIMIELSAATAKASLQSFINSSETQLTDEMVRAFNNRILNANYAYIDEFKRYYFITDITAVRTNLWAISMHVDVLMSFKDTILAQDCYIDRQENKYNKLLIDNMVSFEEGYEVYTEAYINKFFKVSNARDGKNFLIMGLMVRE